MANEKEVFKNLGKGVIDVSQDIVLMDADKLFPYHNNPKEHPPEQVDKIASSIKHYGFIQPIVIDGDNEVIIGHGRLQASRKLGLKKVPVVVKDDLTEGQVKALRIADNKVAESGWDMEALQVELEALDFEILETGFEIDEIEEIIQVFDVDEGELPDLDSGAKEPIQQKTFTLHDQQVELVDRAIKEARQQGGGESELNDNANGNALHYICEVFLNGQC